ncbi:butyryl-CoA:acetate CoA-transferase [Agathobaculum sp. NSJ-28]|uniref:Butyryl-CoA:acetate CoA-transferase n=2 Tax=Agathobaculum TaxID=2048137 RepID=A0A923LT54_9FIRM|nr:MULTISPECIES: butyryl-CoA:acetate CoA-transferase [Butyricicoccaceae]MBS6883621.1 butyryl-CoA:acetate CoA-transferase [Clostridiaceae bacterium]SCI79148.1 Propionyl-CoA:succinate CoA transferase [uncultured Butyricicoccus sp.]MBC5724808.1 butyryl-CoA:acetate CoA-transferase [Agathobaculum faecis]MCU6788500.1 butyryl-CoA:acetate CoA-transferase [Agathobaculum ammoniilyticum]WOC76151.1 butyryl-CoA:acetate CoA-transferase [Intestinibacillus sp. NTUH-41-i26]
MDYEALYQQKLTTADEAVKVVKSGDWVDYGWCTGTACALDKALAGRMSELEDINLRGGILMWQPAIFQIPDVEKKITWNSWHMGGVERKACTAGFGFYNALRYSELPRYYRENVKHVNVAMFQVAPMDSHGYFSFGPNASHLKAVCDVSDVVIVEVNKNMPRCLGGFEEAVHISEVDMVVEGENPPIAELGAGGAPTDVDRAVAKLIVEEIPNGACLQLGIGGMPNTVGSMIAESDLKDLGVHTEMYVDAFVDIAMAGKINGLSKGIDRGKQVYAFGAGTKKLYDYIDNNPECYAAPVSYTNDARTIAQIDNFISINNAVDIDLFGQVNAETAGTKQISGAGGQLDFVLGAYLSKGGKSFICCSSTFKQKDGSIASRIRPTLADGSVVTDARPNVHWFVTEYGKVCLKGLSSWQRAEALISVAHPDFREQLIQDAEKMHIWKRSNKR